MSVDGSPTEVENGDHTVTGQLRGSSMLMVGRILSIVVNLFVQALIARALTKQEFGHFAYALSVVTMLATFIPLGIDRAIPRFVAQYDERGESGKLVGTLLIQLTTIASLGLSVVVVVVGLRGWLGSSVIDDPEVMVVLTALVFLAPIQALDQLAMALFAVYAKPSAIFFRRYLLTPALRLLVVLLLLAQNAGPRFLAIGYVLTGLAGVVLYGLMLRPLIERQGLFVKAREQGISWPWKPVLGYSLPLMVSDVMFAVLNTSDVVLLGRYRDAEAVAAYRVVLPAAKLNQFVMTSFALLYVPLVARLLERRDPDAVSDLYWRTAAWIAVVTFPLFALTFGLAEDVTVAMFGDTYTGSGKYLALLSVGYYFNAALGFNGLTVKTAGRVRYTIVISLVALVTNLALNIVLIPEYGATGAAVATLLTLIAHNILKQLGLRLGTQVALYPKGVSRVYGTIIVAVGIVFAVSELFEPPLLVGVAVVAGVSLVVVWMTRSRLAVLEVFPEVARFPFAKAVFGVKK